MTKVYEIKGKDRCQIVVRYCGAKITAEFKQVAGGSRRSQLVTSDRFVQDALEHDARFGGLFTCVKRFDEADVAKAADAGEDIRSTPPKMVNTVRNLNDAISWFAKKGEMPTSDEDVKALMDKYNVAFPKWTEKKSGE